MLAKDDVFRAGSRKMFSQQLSSDDNVFNTAGSGKEDVFTKVSNVQMPVHLAVLFVAPFPSCN